KLDFKTAERLGDDFGWQRIDFDGFDFASQKTFIEKLKAEEPGIFIIMRGYAAYDVMGGRYVYWRYFITSEGFEGIPDPTPAEVRKLIGKFGLEEFMGNYHFNHIIGKVESFGLDSEPNFEWHTPNSVSFNVVAVYTERINDIGGKERIARTFRIRLYRAAPKDEWKGLVTSSQTKTKL
ncbi:MAG: hypothetical protein ABI954_15670, partial [Pyrinomonadaceae bacterium]